MKNEYLLLSKAVKEWVVENFRQSPYMLNEVHRKQEISHILNTWDWVSTIYPAADIAIEIASYGHDIDRALNDTSDKAFLRENEERKAKGIRLLSYDEQKAKHPKRSADPLVAFLREQKTDTTLIAKVERLILQHETGGDFDSDVIKLADSISFFDNNFAFYFSQFGRKETYKKIKWTMKRIKEENIKELREKAMKFVDPIYQKILRELK